jgi:protein disulfide-isomerase A6
MGAKGYPTLKIVRPSKKKGGRPTVEEYQGARTAKGIVDAVVEKIPNHVRRVTDKSLEAWLKQSNETAKAILFTEKGTTSALLRALAIDYLGSVHFGQIRNKEATAVKAFGIEKYPTFVLLPGGEKEAMIYDGELKKDAMSEFVKQVATPNPEPAPESRKKEKPSKEDKKAESKEGKPSEGEKSKDSKVTDDNAEKVDDADADSDSMLQRKPVAIIPNITEDKLKEKCLTASSKICVLLLIPGVEDVNNPPEDLLHAMISIIEVHDKHIRRHSNFPFYAIEASDPAHKMVTDAFDLKPEVLEVIAVNAMRGWWRRLEGDYTYDGVRAWVDSIRKNEGKKEKLPDSLIISDVPKEADKGAQDSPKDLVEEDAADPSKKEEKVRDEL